MSSKILSLSFFREASDGARTAFMAALPPLSLLLFLLSPSSNLRSEKIRFQWPVEKGTPPALGAISSTFGESRTDHFHAGVDIAGENESIRPVAGGRLLYYNFASMYPYRPMVGTGNQLWLDHGDGWWSGYYHLKELRLMQRYVERSSIIAISGDTGRSGGPHLHFFLTQDYGRLYVNPMGLLPEARESNPPIIEHVVFITDKGVSRLKADETSRIRLTRSYPLYIELRDPGLESGSRRSPKKVTWKTRDAAGKTTGGTIEFNTLNATENGLLLNGTADFDTVYSDSFLKLGDTDFSEGINVIEVSAEDYAGNTGSATFTLDVKKEY